MDFWIKPLLNLKVIRNQYYGKSLGEIEIDEIFESQLTVTESNMVTVARPLGDFKF